MFTKKILALLLVFFHYQNCQSKNAPLVTTPLGTIQGTLHTSDGDRQYSAFEGIPFAKPPLGERRFEEPEPVEPWTGIWEANFLTTCVQSSMTGNQTILRPADEDCLHLNVYVPRAEPNPEEKLEVIVHIHGGAYLYGSAHDYSNPTFLMDHDVIFVTFNYRLGIFGFLSTEDDVVPGNNGLKDQVMALKWVQQNIASFGGNPESVTLTGLSAGGSSVHLHYFSEMSKGLFHRGLSQSGCALNPWSIQDEPLAKAKLLGEAIGCPTCCTKKLVECLKQRPYKQILAQSSLFFGYKAIPYVPFGPVVEKGGSKPFLNKDPYVLLTQGKVYDVPWIASASAHEGLITFTYFQADVNTVNEKWEELAPFLLEYNYTLPRESWKSVAKKIREFYLQDQKMTKENLLQVSQIFSDRLFLVGIETAIREQSKVAKSPMYYYYFNYDESKIVNHGAEAKYFFGDRITGKALSSNDLKMKDVLLDMLVSYAKTGKPKISGVNWEPSQHDELTYLTIDGPENIELKKVKKWTPIAFWQSLGFKENENLIEPKHEL